ncbi:MAG TPA: stage III sporulation protein AE [Candidatus Merdicola faecigallinarum]|uniref:Stage III sporulation protein AE n=1 Tax=Candidatus Merdicola faecigallinarum TaxID=2840862 RepID=A0A9D1S9M6_9FIRM|nr:stage III sporulation protein AE [Candidatus Merdicola faecigallinarum]
MLVIVLVHSILRSISENLENKSVSQITYYVQYLLIASLIMVNFADIIKMVKDTIQNMVGFVQLLVPLLITLMIATGSIISANVIQPVILFMINVISNLFQTTVIPIILVSTAIAVISKVSERVQVDKVAKFMRSGSIWVIGVLLTIFVGVLSVEGTLSSSVDGITAKATKAAVSNFIPVVGKILGDAVDTVIGCSTILKNAVGIVGLVVIISICALPILKLTIITITYHLAAAVCQPIADGKIVKLLEEMGGTFKILLGILCAISVMLIIGITLVIKISNSGLMYR